MFCQKCGTQIPDDAKFCNTCGNPTISGTPKVKTVAPFKLPSLAERLVLGYTLVMFFFMFFGWFRMSGDVGTFSLFSGNLFKVNALLGIAKILAIINVFMFTAYVFFTYVDISRIINSLSSVTLKRLFGFIFYGLYFFMVLFTLIGALVGTDFIDLTVSAVWYFALLGGLIGFVMVLLPGLVRNLVKE
jgi:hypothetical protein